jgi:hypothetical protein
MQDRLQGRTSSNPSPKIGRAGVIEFLIICVALVM